jgi:hypothetical protein
VFTMSDESSADQAAEECASQDGHEVTDVHAHD